VSGIVALLLERRPGLEPEAVAEALQTAAADLGSPGRDDEFGAGLVDAFEAVSALVPSATGGVTVKTEAGR
jgi:subtilisin family serine protease